MDEGGGRIVVCIHADVDGIDALAGYGSHMSITGKAKLHGPKSEHLDDCAEKQITPRVIFSKRSLRASF